MKGTADVMAKVAPDVFAGRRLEISGWTERDGSMYFPQSCIHAIERMRDVAAGDLPMDALYSIHWRVAGVTFSTAYFARSIWDPSLTPQRFWQDLSPLLGEEGVPALQSVCDALELFGDRHGYGTMAFCYYRCWPACLPDADGNPGNPHAFGAGADYQALLADNYSSLTAMAEAALSKMATADARRLCGYLINKLECAQIHTEYCKLGRLLAFLGQAMGHPESPSEYERDQILDLAGRMVEKSHDYLRHYQQWMFDRGDEGMLASYYMTATRYAWRYAHPEEDDRTGRFGDMSLAERDRLRAELAGASLPAGDREDALMKGVAPEQTDTKE
jgi:hypothetical protein